MSGFKFKGTIAVTGSAGMYVIKKDIFLSFLKWEMVESVYMVMAMI